MTHFPASIFFLLGLSLFFGAALADWTDPKRIMNFTSRGEILSTYRDPVSSRTHVIVMDYNPYTLWYLSISPDNSGTLLVKSSLANPSLVTSAVIRGAGDGNRLFLGLTYTSPRAGNSIYFSESSDSGNSWTAPAPILDTTTQRRTLQDMLYLAGTERLFVFFVSNANSGELRVASRARGSVVFSFDTLVARGASLGAGRAKSVLISPGSGVPAIHVAFVAAKGNELMYTNSTSLGAKWTEPRGIVAGDTISSVTNAAANGAVGGDFFFAYHDFGTPALLTFSQTSGMNFSFPIALTYGGMLERSTDALMVCGSKSHSVLASIFVNRFAELEYSWWRVSDMWQSCRAYPGEVKEITSVGADCVLDAEREWLSVMTVVAGQMNGVNSLFFAIETQHQFKA